MLVQKHLFEKASDNNTLTSELVKELSEKVRAEILFELRTTGNSASIEQMVVVEDKIVNEVGQKEASQRVVIDHDLSKEDSSTELRLDNGQPIVFSEEDFKVKKDEKKAEIEVKQEAVKKIAVVESSEKATPTNQPLGATEERETKRSEKKKQTEERKHQQKKDEHAKPPPPRSELTEEAKNFEAKKINQIKPKKMWIPIPNR